MKKLLMGLVALAAMTFGAFAGEPLVYGPFGTEDDVVIDKVEPTIFAGVSLTFGETPAASNDCVAVYRKSNDQLCGLGKVIVYRGQPQLTLSMQVTEGTEVYFKGWQQSSGTTTNLVASVNGAAAAETILMPESGSVDSVLVLSTPAEAPVPPTCPIREDDVVGDKVEPTIFAGVVLAFGETPMAVGDVVGMYRTTDDSLCGYGEVVEYKGAPRMTLSVQVTEGTEVYFTGWQQSSGTTTNLVASLNGAAAAETIRMPESGSVDSVLVLSTSAEAPVPPVVEPVVTNTITYLGLEGAANPNPATFTTNDLPLTLAPLTREGWRFLGWTPQGGVIPAGTVTNVTFTAQWEEIVEPPVPPVVEPVVTNTITYLDLEGAANPNPATFTTNDLPLVLAPLTREGWRFLGWTPQDGVIPAGTVTNVTFAAQWEEIVEPPVPPVEPGLCPIREDDVVGDKVEPTIFAGVVLAFGETPMAVGDVVGMYRTTDDSLCGYGEVIEYRGAPWMTLSVQVAEGTEVYFVGWQQSSDMTTNLVASLNGAAAAETILMPESGSVDSVLVLSTPEETPEGTYKMVPGEKVEIETGLPDGYKATGLPQGLKYDSKSGKITGAATKPTVPEGVVVKFTKKDFDTEELTIVVTAIPKVTVVMEGVNSPSDTDGCKVTGAGAYLVGKKVTLKATVPKGVVFMGWFDDEGVVATQATYSFMMGKEDVALVAKFKKEVMTVECEALSSKESFPAGVLGAEDGIALDISTESGVKSVKVDKLPAGMKYDTKTGRITGAPTKAGGNKVVITVTAKSGAVTKKEIEVKVAAMPVMAVGTFTGFVSVGEDNLGTFTLTTTDAGKLTAKVITAAGTVSFSGKCWDVVEKGVYRATLTTKKGETLALTLDSTAAWDANQLSGEFTSVAIAETKKNAAVPSRTYSLSAQRNAFGKTWYFAAMGDATTGWKLAYTEDTKGAALTVTLKADGSTSIAGKLPNGTDAKGKAVTIKVSASGYANVGLMHDGVIAADFAPVLTVNKVKTVLAIRTNLWFDRKNDHESGIGEARFVK